MAGDRLGMEAPVERVLVLALTVGAERKSGHGRVGAVIRDAGDDTVARTAVRAGYEWIAEAPVVRVKQLPQAVGAEGGIGGNLDVRCSASAREYRK